MRSSAEKLIDPFLNCELKSTCSWLVVWAARNSMATSTALPATDPTVPSPATAEMAEDLLNARSGAAEQPAEAENKATVLASAAGDIIRLLASLRTDDQQSEVCAFVLQRVGDARSQRRNVKSSAAGGVADSLTNLSLSREKQPEPTWAWVPRDCPKAHRALKAEGLRLRTPVATGSAGDPLRYFGYGQASSGGGGAARAEGPAAAAGKSRARVSSASAARNPRCVREMSAADRAVVDAFADALGRAGGGKEGRQMAVRQVLLRAREEAQEELMAWNDRGTKLGTIEEPDVEAWHRAVERQVAAEMAATERLWRAAHPRRPRPKRAATASKPAKAPPQPFWRTQALHDASTAAAAAEAAEAEAVVNRPGHAASLRQPRWPDPDSPPLSPRQRSPRRSEGEPLSPLAL